MCMMLYLGTRLGVPVKTSADLRIEEVTPAGDSVRQWFSLPHVHFVGAHTGCSCGFPSVTAEVPIGFFAGMFDDHPDRAADLRSVRALLEVIREQLSEEDEVQLYPVWNGEEGEPPKGTVNLPPEQLVADQFFLNERFLHRITRRTSSD